MLISVISINSQTCEAVSVCVRVVHILVRRTLQNAAEKSIVFYVEAVTTKRCVRYNGFTDRRSKCAV